VWVVVSVPTPARPGRSFSPLERPGSTRWFVPNAANASESAEPEPSASKKKVSPEDHGKSVFSEDSRARDRFFAQPQRAAGRNSFEAEIPRLKQQLQDLKKKAEGISREIDGL